MHPSADALASAIRRRCRRPWRGVTERPHPPTGLAAAVVAVVTLGVAGSAATSNYTIQRGDTLSALAKRLGTTVADLAHLNGLADPDRIIAGHALIVPGQGGAALAASPTRTHVVQPGETLSAIARRYGVSVDALAAANGLTDATRMMAGARLVLGGRPAPLRASGPTGGTGTHVVAGGETLSAIARRYGVTTSALAQANGITNVNRIREGATLEVPVSWRCPVAGGQFVNDYGVPKADGRFHEGVDLFAPRGTPVVASVSGRVEQLEGSRGGLQYWLHGDDGVLYIGTHLDAFGEAGRVGAGEVVGYVGTSGNAQGTPPHLHFETHPGGIDAGSANPYPRLVSGC